MKAQARATESITNIASIAEESAAATQEVLAGGQEQTASAEQLVLMSVELGSIITGYRETNRYFNIEKEKKGV